MASIEQNAIEMLLRCRSLTLATIDQNDFPRPVPMTKVASDGLHTVWIATSAKSEKVTHIKLNPNTGISIVEGDNSITFTGRAQIVDNIEQKHRLWNDRLKDHFTGIDDPDYVLIRFESAFATISINNEFKKIAIDNPQQ